MVDSVLQQRLVEEPAGRQVGVVQRAAADLDPHLACHTAETRRCENATQRGTRFASGRVHP